jgi:alpha-ribazole phosphatase
VALRLLRHLKPEIAEGVCYGQMDIPLAPGWQESLQALLSQTPPPALLISSPLQRCRLIAEGMGAAWGMPVVIENRFIEMDFGAWEGIAWQDVPRAELDAWARDPLHARPHGGESVAMLHARVQDGLTGARARLAQGQDGVIVTHAGVIKVHAPATPEGEAIRRTVAFGAWVLV